MNLRSHWFFSFDFAPSSHHSGDFGSKKRLLLKLIPKFSGRSSILFFQSILTAKGSEIIENITKIMVRIKTFFVKA